MSRKVAAVLFAFVAILVLCKCPVAAGEDAAIIDMSKGRRLLNSSSKDSDSTTCQAGWQKDENSECYKDSREYNYGGKKVTKYQDECGQYYYAGKDTSGKDARVYGTEKQQKTYTYYDKSQKMYYYEAGTTNSTSSSNSTHNKNNNTSEECRDYIENCKKVHKCKDSKGNWVVKQ